jgi:hypothetical protein
MTVKVITTHIDLIFSEDDDGWYFQRAGDWEVSQLFPCEEDAMQAYREDKLEWS